jgi:hypothetical protein
VTSLRDRLNEKGLTELPVGYHKESNALVRLGEVMDRLSELRPVDELDQSQRAALVVARWKAGGWADMVYGHELITMDRAISEVDGNTPLGRDLVAISLRAIEMMLEDLSAVD